MLRVKPLGVLAASVVTVSTSLCSAAVVLDDSFNDGAISNGADLNDAAWVVRNTSTTRAYSLDDTGGFGAGAKVLVFRNNNGTASDRPLVGVAGATSPTLNVGDKVRISVDFRVSAYTGTGGAGALRIGMYNSNGTTMTDGSTNVNNDYGYASLFSMDGSTSNSYTNSVNMLRETGANGDIMFGTDRDFASSTGDNFVVSGTPVAGRVNTASIYTAILELTKTGATTASVTTTLKVGSTVVSSMNATDSNTAALPSLTFNEFVILDSSNDNTIVFDNFQLETIVPEPVSLSVLGLGTLALSRRRRPE